MRLSGPVGNPAERRTSDWLARRHALDDAELRALELLHLEPLGPQVFEWLAEQVVGLEANRERLEQPLAEAHRQHWAAHVLEQEEAAAAPQHPPDLGDGGAVVGDRAQRQRGDDSVEGLVGKVERLRVA